eukprot:55386_1
MASIGDEDDDMEDIGGEEEDDVDGMDISDKNLLISLLMNQQLSAGIPITNRIFNKYKTFNFDISCVELQGYRDAMEDKHLIYFNLNNNANISIFGVFDGHGGRQCAEYCATNLCETLTKYLLSETTVDSAFNLCISELDERAIEYSKDASGSTCCIILIDNIKYDLFCCNVGDSRSILINKNCTKHKQLSIEHKPEYPIEKQRIENANGWVTFGRVCGILAVSRSLGDKDFKYEIENLIISKPDITHHKLILDEDKYIILACDGLYDVFTNEQCTEWINNNNNNN